MRFDLKTEGRINSQGLESAPTFNADIWQMKAFKHWSTAEVNLSLVTSPPVLSHLPLTGHVFTLDVLFP